jgi:mycothiol synthase
VPRRIRPPFASEAEAVLDVIRARDMADLGVVDFTLEDLESDWARPGVELEHDARVAAGEGGAIGGDALVLGGDALVYVHPEAEGQGHGTVLRRWAEARAAERGTEVLRQFAFGSNERARRHLRDAGYKPVQRYFRLRAELADVPPPSPEPRLRTFEPGDEEAVHRLIQDAFAKVEGSQTQTLEEWRAKGREKAGHDPSLWLVLADDEGVAGAALGERWEDGAGYVAEVAVAARARRRGYGRALLLAVLDAFRRAGLEHAELSVNASNREALGLYESVGMRPVWEGERWEKALGRS